MSLSLEPSVDSGFDEDDLRKECYPNKCAIWCVTLLHGLSYPNYCLIANAAEDIKQGSIGLNMEETFQLGQSVGLFNIIDNGYVSYKYIENEDTIQDIGRVMQTIRKLEREKKLTRSIICVDGHCALGQRVSGKRVYVHNVNPTITFYDSASIRGVIY